MEEGKRRGKGDGEEEREIHPQVCLSMHITVLIDQSINQLINQPTNQSINQSTNQSINQSINQSVNQSINQSINDMSDLCRTAGHYCHFPRPAEREAAVKSTERDQCLPASTTSVQKKTGLPLWEKGREERERVLKWGRVGEKESSQVVGGRGRVGHEAELRRPVQLTHHKPFSHHHLPRVCPTIA